ncbi:hypothetical protein BDV12DRAFT_93788 [Aspergillus spectabilis]
MSAPEHRDDSTDEEEDDEIGGLLEVSFQFLECLDVDTGVGVSFRRSQEGDIVPGSLTPFGPGPEAVLDRAIAAAASATDEGGRRRPRVPPERPPRPEQPIFTWDELVGWTEPPPESSSVARERQAAELATPRELDNEPDRETWPANWETHHDYFLWACRGTVPVITDHLQAVFAFDPPIDETFVAARLCGVNAYKQMTFLAQWLPGETHSLQRAEARGVVYEADISHPNVRMGSQLLDMKQSDHGSNEYIEPVVPCWAPRHWGRTYDSILALYLGEPPSRFHHDYNWAFDDGLSIEFIRIRMAQIPHLNLNWPDIHNAKAHRALLLTDDTPGDNAHASHLF